MFHGVARQVTQGVLSTNTLADYLQGNRADEKRIGDIISESTKLSPNQVAAFFQESKTMDAAEALKSRIIDEVAELHIPADARTVMLGQ
jgi:ATP-dependent protease ClpP protease subunit